MLILIFFNILDYVPLYFMQMETPVPAGHHFILPVMIQRSDQVLHRELIALLSKVVSGLSCSCDVFLQRYMFMHDTR